MDELFDAEHLNLYYRLVSAGFFDKKKNLLDSKVMSLNIVLNRFSCANVTASVQRSHGGDSLP